MTYRQCLWDPVKVSITKHSPSLRQYARSLSLHGLKCSDRSVEYVVVSAEETRKGKKCCEDKYCMFLQHTLNKFDHTGPQPHRTQTERNGKHRACKPPCDGSIIGNQVS